MVSPLTTVDLKKKIREINKKTNLGISILIRGNKLFIKRPGYRVPYTMHKSKAKKPHSSAVINALARKLGLKKYF